MNRRDTFKTLLIGTFSGGAIVTGLNSCESEIPTVSDDKTQNNKGYGRTPKEQERDEKLRSEQFFNEEELATIAILCDIILPKDEVSGAATDADVPAFIEFIAKDLPNNQLPLRGGLMWLDGESNQRFSKIFKDCSDKEQLEIIEDIAYPDNENPLFTQGIQFFNLMRNLTVTGFYTTQMGIKDLGYKGNVANLWDGVPKEVLAEHDVDYDPEWLAKCINHDTREAVATWDDEGNLLT